MDHAHPVGQAWWATTLGMINFWANLLIVGGYMVVPFTALIRLPLTTLVRISGIFFFVCCAITHLSMAFEPRPAAWLVANHIVQAAAVWLFVLAFAFLVRKAAHHRGAVPDRLPPGGES
jgi:hypothetical protein